MNSQEILHRLAHEDPRFVVTPMGAADLGHCGGKAANLIALRDAGFNVPTFAVVPVTALPEFFVAHGLPVDSTGDDDEIRRRVAAIEALPLPAGVTAQLDAAWRDLGPGPLCVRSSGTCEDLGDLSFAGQYESVLDIHDRAGLEAAVRRCWASMFAPRVVEYFRANRLPFARAGMALVVQKYIQARFSGVTFTVNPLTGQQYELLLEYCEGAGEQLVSGRVTPKRVVADHRRGQVIEGELPPGMPGDAIALFRRVQILFGRPQDIEWALGGDGTLWLVQSRPITSITYAIPHGPWTTADFRDGGVASSVVTPLMASLYDYIWHHAMPKYFEIIRLLLPGQREAPWGATFYGRPYWNLGEVVKCLLKIPGFDEKNFFDDLGIRTVAEYRFRRIPFTPQTIVGIVPTAMSLERYYNRRIALNKRFRQGFATMVAPFAQRDLTGLADGEFAQKFRRLITEVYFFTETSYFMTIYNTSNAKLEFKVRLDALNAKGHDLSYIKLISGLLNVKHLDTLKDLAELARAICREPGLREKVLATRANAVSDMLAADPAGQPILAQFNAFLDKYFYHSARELDIAVPRWEDDAATVWRLLETFLRDADPDPEAAVAHEKRQRALYHDEVARARAAFNTLYDRLVPVDRWLFFRALRCTRSYCWWREEMRDHSSRVYALIRRWVVEAGRRLGLAEGRVFWLTWQQLADALDGVLAPAEVTRLVGQARDEGAMFRAFENPNEFGLDVVAAPAGGATTATREGPGAGVLQGVACSPGTVEGTVRVVNGLDEVDRIRRGEILVTRFTDPGWTPIFHLLGAVVTETGGILSHAAVISREYGIPAVLNVPGATTRLREGQRVRVDGAAGTISVLG